jgi:hypothetical protein
MAASITIDPINGGNIFYKKDPGDFIHVIIQGAIYDYAKSAGPKIGAETSTVSIIKIKIGDLEVQGRDINKTFVNSATNPQGETHIKFSWQVERDLILIGDPIPVTVFYIITKNGIASAQTSITTTFKIIVDNAGPELQFAVPSAAYLSKKFESEILGSVQDNISGLAQVSWNIAGTSLAGDIQFPLLTKSSIQFNPKFSLPRIGQYTIRLTAVDALGNATIQEAQVTGIDDIGPLIQILAPLENETMVAAQLPFTLKAKGTAYDSQNGMVGGQAAVKWSLDGENFQPVQHSGNDWSVWQQDMILTSYGSQQIYFQLTNAAGMPNIIPVVHRIKLLNSYKPNDLEERLSPRAYLEDLLQYISDHIQIPNLPVPVYATTGQLEDLLLQPFETISQPLFEKGEQPVPLLRIVNEILHSELEKKSFEPLGYWKDKRPSDQPLTIGSNLFWTDITGRTPDLDVPDIPAITLGGGGAYLFQYTGQGFQIPYQPHLELGKNDQDFTIAFRLKVGEGPKSIWRCIFRAGVDSDVQRTPALWLHPDKNKFHVCVSTSHNWNERIDNTSQEINLRQWYHVTVVKRKNDLQFYLDGKLDSKITLIGKTISNKGNLYFGKNPWSDGFVGTIQDFQVHGRALDEEIISMLAEGKEPFMGDVIAKSDYILRLYEALLHEMGTSYAELRMMRGALAESRQAAARRLLIGLSSQATPDELSQITFGPDQLSEKNLEHYFGIIPYGKDPLANYPKPLLLQWQEQYLEVGWLEQDWKKRNGTELPVIIDPDLIDGSDLIFSFIAPVFVQVNGQVIPVHSDPITNLLMVRRNQLSDYYQQLKKIKGKTTKAKFESLLESVYPEIKNRRKVSYIERMIDEGADVSALVKEMNLSFPAYNRIRQLMLLSGQGELTTDEWEDVFHIFTQVYKTRQFPVWASEEVRISLSPKWFCISNNPKDLNPWRASTESYRQWQELLQARIQQRSALIEGYYEKLRNAETRVLPGLRDAMLNTLSGGKNTEAFATQRSERYFIDFSTGASIITTRVEQACATLQNMVFSIRTKRLPDDHPAENWEIADEGQDDSAIIQHFDKEWAWIRSYETWRAAVSVFLFPENYLFPLTKDNPTEVFNNFISALRAPEPFTPQKALEIVKENYKNVLPNFPFQQKRTDAELETLKRFWTEVGWAKETIHEISFYIPLAIALQLQRSGEYLAALDWYQSIYAYQLPKQNRKISPVISEETNSEPDLGRNQHWCRQLDAHFLAKGRTANSYTRFTLMSLVRCFLEFGDTEFTKETYESLTNARSLYITALELLSSPDLKTPPSTRKVEPPVPNPAIEALRLKAENQLRKIREGRNIAGMKRDIAYARNAGLLPGYYQPTPYHYKILLERGKQLVAIAQQIEAAYLSAMEKREEKTYRRFEANKGLELTLANLNVYCLREAEALFGEVLAKKQIDKSQYTQRELTHRINRGLNYHERQMLQGYQDLLYHKNIIAGLDASIGATGAIKEAGGIIKVLETLGTSLFSGAALASLYSAKGIATGFLNAAEADLQANSFYASHERRVEEWRFQSGLTAKETDIAWEQLRQTQAHIQVTQEERKVAELQARQARDTVEFLDQQQLNEEMYEWMSEVLSGVYAYFLQQAASIARLAQHQLAFERQEAVPSYIRGNYWELPNKTNAPNESGRDRLGLTSAELLLQDIHQLDHYAFESEKRKLNLSQTLSLAQLFPQEFQEFKETGVLRFATSLALFDQEFPGHYLRMVKRIKTSVIALVPPGRGIRAALYSNGISRVVARGEPFRDLLLRREPEYVALTAPIGASGVFDLDMQPDLLQPFEGSGIETFWEFEMPKASNPINYQTVADILITIDYTALYDDGYRQRVIKGLPRNFSGMRSFSIRGNYPEQWYDLLNAEQTDEAQQYLISLRTVRSDFPGNLDLQGLETLVVMLVFKKGKSYPYPVGLTFNGTDAGKILSNDAGILSTRHNASAWRFLLNFDAVLPIGDWVLNLQGNGAVDRKRLEDSLKEGELEDIIVIFGYRGLLPDWPK